MKQEPKYSSISLTETNRIIPAQNQKERSVYLDAYFSLMQSNPNPSPALLRAKALQALDAYRRQTKAQKKTEGRVVDSPRDASGRPACFTEEEWNYGCTPGQFGRARKSGV